MIWDVETCGNKLVKLGEATGHISTTDMYVPSKLSQSSDSVFAQVIQRLRSQREMTRVE